MYPASATLRSLACVGFLLLITAAIHAQCFTCASAPAGVIWCDDFEDTVSFAKKYFEYNNDNGDFVPLPGLGKGGGKGMRVIFQQGETDAGGFKKSIGRTPSTYIGKNAAQPSQKINEVFWKMDLRLQPGWTGGGGDKLSRATCLAASTWAQGMMAHLWSGGGGNNNYLVMDPASGIDVNGNLVATTYNDFPNLRWLGAKTGTIPLFSTANSGRWFCVEGHAKLNTPGQSDGVFEFWVNDTLQARSSNLNWHGNYNQDTSKLMINAVLFENYWNAGSPVTQERYFDNVLISTQRIGCSCLTSVKEEPEMFSDLLMYPNPASRNVYVEFSAGKPGELGIEFYDVTGKKIKSETFGLHTGLNSISLDLNGIPGGLYFFRLKSGDDIFNGKMGVE